MRSLGTGLLIFALACAAGPSPATASEDCPSVQSLRLMPLKDEKGKDPVFDKLRFDGRCEIVLLRALDSTELMPDPRGLSPREGFVVSDAAVFLLLDRLGISYAQVIPGYQQQGIDAYFSYVRGKGNRNLLLRRLRELIARAPIGDCPNVASIGKIGGETGVDPTFQRFMTDDDCELKLLRSLASLESMPELRSSERDTAYVVGDAALLLLMKKRGLSEVDLAPYDLAARVRNDPESFWQYVHTGAGRKYVVSRVRDLVNLAAS